jgi:5-methylcytosine-specific restriction endonuclease McrA
MAAIQLQLSCGCRDAPYATRASFTAHLKTQRHEHWAAQVELKDARLRVAKLEHEVARLSRVIDELVGHRPAGAVATRSVGAKRKKDVAAGQHWRCNRCNALLASSYQVDHIVPLHKGGSNDVANLQALCEECHADKTARERGRVAPPGFNDGGWV